jgi:hypothetical protein
VKSFAKRVRSDPGDLPSEPYAMIYLASIVAALISHDRSITRMSRASLLANLYWALTQSWVDPDFSALFRKGIRELEGTREQRLRTKP